MLRRTMGQVIKKSSSEKVWVNFRWSITIRKTYAGQKLFYNSKIWKIVTFERHSGFKTCREIITELLHLPERNCNRITYIGRQYVGEKPGSSPSGKTMERVNNEKNKLKNNLKRDKISISKIKIDGKTVGTLNVWRKACKVPRDKKAVYWFQKH